MIRLFSTTVRPLAIQLVNEALSTTFISAGKKADLFETELSTKLGLYQPVVVNSGTSALHLALKAANIKDGDEVILPAQSFIASGLSVKYQNAVPVFCDINYMTGNIDTSKIVEKITERTKAIMVVHWGGYPCDMDEILEIATKHNLIVIEDAAHALGAIYKGKKIGTISHFTCFSFQAIKHLTTGDGGAVCCTNSDHENLLKKLRWFNIDRDKDQPDILGERVYNSHEIGYKYHMNDVAAAMGLGNIDYMTDKLSRLKEIVSLYNEALKTINGITLFERKDDRESANWLYGFHVEERINFIKKLKESGIPSSVIHLGIDDNLILGGKDYTLENQRKFDNTQIHIPCNDELTDEDVQKIISTIKSGW